MPTVLLATFALLPEGEYGGEHLLTAFAERDVTARWVSWDDPAVDWSAADLVAVRSTWDYHRRLPEFLDWARATEAVAPVLNGADVFAWNADKSYLLALGEHVPVVPTRLLEDRGLVPALQAAIEELDAAIAERYPDADVVAVSPFWPGTLNKQAETRERTVARAWREDSDVLVLRPQPDGWSTFDTVNGAPDDAGHELIATSMIEAFRESGLAPSA